MADNHSKEVRSMNMSHIRSKNSKPEELVRKYLFSKGFRYRSCVRTNAAQPQRRKRACFPAWFSVQTAVQSFIFAQLKACRQIRSFSAVPITSPVEENARFIISGMSCWSKSFRWLSAILPILSPATRRSF